MKIGELFVDLGVNAGNSINTLTQFSIKFLAIKNMAQQMVGLFDELFGGTARFGQGLYNQNQITGMSVKLMQELANKEKQLGVAAGTTLNSLKAVQKANADILQGQGNAKPFQKLGIDVSRLRQPQELLDEIMQKILKLEPAFQQTMLSEFGLSQDLLVLWKEQGIKLREDLLLTQQDTSKLNELQKTATALKQTFSAIFDKTVVENANGIIEALKSMTHWMAENKEIVMGVIEAFGLLLGAKMIAALVAWGAASAAALAPWLALAGAVVGIQKLIEWMDEKSGIKADRELNLDKKKVSFSDFIDMAKDPHNEELIREKLGEENWNKVIASQQMRGNTTITDNSQVIINTTDGPEAYQKIATQKNTELKAQLSNAELLGAR